MKVALSWLKELVDIKLSPKEFVDKLSLVSIGVKELTDDYLELDLTYNRGDLLSLRGVAREVAAITNLNLNFDPDLRGDAATYGVGVPKVEVKVENKRLCPVYSVAKIENLKVERSNDTWVKKLNDSGIRAINNIADVTNLIMLEYGQPMHAFDAEKVTDETLVVRTAKPGETLVTLDGKVRKLHSSDLLIADPKKALGLAGVMGGKQSEVSDTTTTILLEAAIFDPIANRETSKRHGLYSEASKRFQHGLTKTNLIQALSAAIKMYEGMGGKLTGLTLTGNLEDKPKTITMTQQKLNSLIGIDIPSDFVETSLQSLGFKPERTGVNVNHLRGGLAWHVTPPYWRLDVNIEEDLIEEVARMYGYEKIPPKELEGEVPESLDQTLPKFIYDLKVGLKDAGLTEVQTYSFYSSKTLSTFHFPLSSLIRVANPISSETEYLKDHIWPNLIEVVAKNIKQGYKDIGIFEIGKVYAPKRRELPNESYRLAVALMNGSDNPIQELCQIYQGVKLAHIQGVQLGNRNLFHPTRFTPSMAEVHPRILNKLGIENRVAILEIELESLVKV